MLVATYNISLSDKVRVLKRVDGRHKWLVEIWVDGDGGRHTHEVKNKDLCYLKDILVTALSSLDELVAEVANKTNAGWSVRMLR